MTRSASLRRAGSGFSLVELSIVTLIIGIFLTLGLSAMNAVRENTALSATIAKQAAIKEALIGYLRLNSRLPCPDTDPVALAAPDGIENRATPGNPATACSAAFGTIPYVTLGISRDATQDGWGNLFSYHVSNTAGANTDWTLTASFRTGNTGVITVNDRANDGAAATPFSTTVVTVIVSHGPNGFGAYSIGGTRNALAAAGTDERDNTDANATYYRRNFTTDDAAWPTKGAFDDVVMYISADDLLSPLYKDGSLTPPTAAVQQAFQKFKLAITGYAMATAVPAGSPGTSPSWGAVAGCTTAAGTPRCRLIPFADVTGGNGWQNVGQTAADLPYLDLGFTLADGTDPWGVRYRYNPLASVATNGSGSGISSTLPAGGGATVAYTITSNGPDRAAGTGDDISLNVSVGEIRGALAGLVP